MNNKEPTMWEWGQNLCLCFTSKFWSSWCLEVKKISNRITRQMQLASTTMLAYFFWLCAKQPCKGWGQNLSLVHYLLTLSVWWLERWSKILTRWQVKCSWLHLIFLNFLLTLCKTTLVMVVRMISDEGRQLKMKTLLARGSECFWFESHWRGKRHTEILV